MIVNEHFGKVVAYNTAGVDIELITIEFPVDDEERIVKCIDAVGTPFTVLRRRTKRTDKVMSADEVYKILSDAHDRCMKRLEAKEVQAS